jgi:WhiB family redox-sensing transcriptional regulator
MSEPRWRERAACKDMPTALFFSSYNKDIQAAKKVCNTCPVRRTCLEDSLEHQDRFGVFGGADHFRRRQALQIDREGHATINAKPIRCPLCGERDITTLVKRRSWMQVKCPTCELSWVAKRVAPKKKTTVQEKSTGDSDGQAVEPAV